MGWKKFGPKQIETLKAEFGKLEKVSVARLEDFHQIFADMPDNAIEQLAKANIKFLSLLAMNEGTRRLLG